MPDALSIDDFLDRCLAEDIAEVEAVLAITKAYADHFSGELDSEWKWVHFTKPSDRKHGWSSRHLDTDFDPARVLRMLRANQHIVEMYRTAVAGGWEITTHTLWRVLVPMAQEYQDRLGYDSAWIV